MYSSPGQTLKTCMSHKFAEISYFQFFPALSNSNLVLHVCISEEGDEDCCYDSGFEIFLCCMRSNMTYLLCINIMCSVLSACLSKQVKQTLYHAAISDHPDMLHKAAQLSLISIFHPSRTLLRTMKKHLICIFQRAFFHFFHICQN